MGALSLDDEDDGEEKEGVEVEEDQQELKEKQNPGKFKVLSDTIYYSDIPRSLTATPEKVTEMNLDKTPILLRILAK